jgi:glycosyltransferase involved in cell wall biosynthesis
VPFLLSDLDVRILAPVFTEQIGRDEPNVHRFWDKDDCADSLSDKAEELGLKALIINFHFGFFSISRLAKLINFLSDNGIQCIIIFHACRDKDNSLSAIQSALARADRLLVHSIQDLNWFKELGLVANVSLFPHGVVRLPQYPKPSSVVLPNELRGKRLLGTFGFLMPHKGVLELIQAFSRLLPRHPDLGLVLLTSLYPKPEVQEHHQECLQAIKNLGLESHVYINTDFLPLEESLTLLTKCCLIIFPYQYTGESSSAAVRVGLGSNRPVAVSPLDIFDDVQGAVHVLPGTDGQSLAQGLDRLLSDPWQLHSLDRAREEWLKIHAWQSVARRLAGMIKSWTL